MASDLTPAQVSARLRSDEPPVLVDVREDWERDRAAISGAIAVPMGELPARLHELPDDRDLVFFCHHGSRSAQVVAWLQRQGVQRVANLSGGIDRWSADVDPSIPAY